MPLRPHQTVHLIIASVALALIAEGALLWKLSARKPQAPVPTPLSTPTARPAITAPTAMPLFVAPGTAPSVTKSVESPKPLVASLTPTKNVAPADPKQQQAKSYFETASRALQRKDFKTALENFRRVAQLAPNNLPTRLNLALLYLNANQPASAIPHLQQAAKLDPKSPAPRFQLAQAYLALRQPARALAPLQETVRLAPEERSARALLAQVYLAQKRPTDAYKQWSALAQRQPRDVEAHLQAAALAADALRQPREAEKWLRRAQSGNPKDPRAALLLGRLFLGQKQPKRAAVTLGEAAKARPDVFEIYPALADARLAAGDLNGARGALLSALLRLPTGKTSSQKAQIERARGNLHLSLGRVLGQSKNHRAARQEFERAVRLLPREAEPQALLALAALQSGDKRAAVAALQKTLQIDPKRARDRLTLAQLLAQNQNFRAAEPHFALYAQAQPRDLTALNQWAQVTFRLKQPQKALPILEKIAALDPKNPAPLLQSGAILRDAKRFETALLNFEKGLARRPDDASALFEVARLQSALKRPGATETWQKLIVVRPDFLPAYPALLAASERNSDATKARLFLARQLGNSKDNPRVVSEILRFYAKQGRTSQAKALLSDVIKRNPAAKSAQAALDSYATPKGAPITAPTALGTPKSP